MNLLTKGRNSSQLRYVPDLRHRKHVAAFPDKSFSKLRFDAYAKDLHRALRNINAMKRDYDFIKPRPMMIDPPNNQLVNGTKYDELIPSITGASSLAGMLKARIEMAKAKFVASGSKVDEAFAKLDNAGKEFEKAAQKIDAEAESALSQIRQLSNE